jgi:hypothetical protein
MYTEMGKNNEHFVNTAHCLLNTAIINVKYMRKKENSPEHGDP